MGEYKYKAPEREAEKFVAPGKEELDRIKSLYVRNKWGIPYITFENTPPYML